MIVKHQAAEPTVALLVRNAIDDEVVVGKRGPDREKEARRKADRFRVDLVGRLPGFFQPLLGEVLAIDGAPGTLEQLLVAHIFAPGGTDEFEPRDRCAFLLFHEGPGPRLQRNHPGLGVHQIIGGAVIVGDAQDALKGDRRPPPCDLDREQMRGRATDRVGAQHGVVDEGRRIDQDGLDPDIEPSGLARSRYARLDECEELVEDLVLQRDRQRQDAVQPPLDRREVIFHDAVLVAELETGALLELGMRDAGQLPSDEQMKPAHQCRAGIFTFEVVGGIEQVLTTGLALTAGERAQAVESAGDRAREAELPLAVGRHWPEQGCARLMGAMGPSKALNRAIGPPSRLQEEMDALLLVRDVARGVIGAPRAARIGEDEDPFATLHEGGCLGLAGPGRPAFELLPSIARRDEPLRSAGHLSNIVVAEGCKDAIQRRHDRWQCAEMLDELGPRRLGLGIVDGNARLILHRDRALRAGIVGEDPHLTGWESALQIVDHIFPGREVDLEVRAVVGAERA